MKNITKSSKKSNKTQKSKVFQPLIASSLALALGVSVSVAGTFHVTTSGSYNQPYDVLYIYLPADQANSITVNLGDTRRDTPFKGQIGGQGIHGSPDTGDVIVNIMNGSGFTGNIQTGTASNGNDFSSNIVTFSGNTSGSVVFVGDIISYGTRSGSLFLKENGNHVTFEAGSMRGNIRALSTNPSDASWKTYGYNIVTFSANAAQKIDGGITAEGGENDVVFSGSGAKTITGNITAQVANDRDGKNRIVSTASSLTIGSGGGRISTGNRGYNFITADSLIFNLDEIRAGNGDGRQKNLIEVKNSLTVNRSLSIIADNSTSNGGVKFNILKIGGNSVTFNNGAKITDLSAISLDIGNLERPRNILSFDSTASNITFTIDNINKTSTIGSNNTGYIAIGKGLTTGTAAAENLDHASSSFTGNWSSSSYQASNVNLTIADTMYAKRGNNYVSVGSAILKNLSVDYGGTNNIKANDVTINGSVVGISRGANTNANNIVANTLTFSSTATAITAGTNVEGWGVKNRFDISGDTTFNTDSLVITADSTFNAGGVKHNILKFGGNVRGSSANNRITIDRILATTVNNNLTNTANILSFDGLSADTTLNIGNINDVNASADATGYNYIGKSLTSGSGSSLALVSGFGDTNWSEATYRADNLALNVAGNVYAKYGKNYINVKSANIDGKIDGNGGFNNIAVSQDFSSGDIQARWGGGNNLIIGGNATFNGDISTEGARGAADRSGANSITFLGSATSITMNSGSKISVGGTGNNTLIFQGNQRILSDLTLERVDGSGKNVFDIANAKGVTFDSGKMLHTLNGETEIIFQGNSAGNSGGTFSGKAQTDDGTTTFVFSQDNGTYAISGELSANGAGQNIIDLSSKSATISTDLTLSGSPTGGGNIIKIGDGKSLSFADSITNKTLSTTSGVSQINFLNASGAFNGDLNTSGGTMTFSFQDNGTYGVSGDFGASNTGKNIFDLSSKSITISNDLTFSGTSVDASAGNIINIGNGRSLTLSGGGGSRTLTTNSGLSTVNFNGASGNFGGKVSTNNGVTLFNFNEDGNFEVASEFASSGAGKNIINVTSHNATLNSGLVFKGSSVSGGSGNIIDIGSGKTLTLGGSAGSGNIDTQSGKTHINFASGFGTLAGGVSTASGADTLTTITLQDRASGVINGIVGGDGSNDVLYKVNASGTNSLTLNGANNNIRNLKVEDAGNAILAGNNATINTINLDGSATTKLTLKNTSSTITNLTNNGIGIFSLDGTNNAVTAFVRNTVTSADLTLNFNGRGASNGTQLTLAGGGNTLKTLTVNSGSTNNKLLLTTGKTTFQKVATIDSGSDITIDLANNVEIALNEGMITYGSSTFVVDATSNGARSATISGGTINASELKLMGGSTDSASAILKNNSLVFTTLTTTGNATNTLTLDASSNAVSTTIKNVISGANLDVVFGGTSTHIATFTLENANGEDTTLKSLTLKNASSVAQNIFNLKAKTTTINEGITVASNQGLTINFVNLAVATLVNDVKNSGNALIDFKGNNGILNGAVRSLDSGNTNVSVTNAGTIVRGIETATSATTNITFASSANTLKLQGESNDITLITANGSSNTLKLDAVNNNAVTTTVKNAIKGNMLNVQLSGKDNQVATLTLKNTDGDSEIKTLTLTEAFSDVTSNVLNLENARTKIGGGVSVGASQGLTINLENNGVNLESNITSSGNTLVNFKGGTNTVSGSILADDGTTTLDIAKNTDGLITGEVSGISNIVVNFQANDGSDDNSLNFGYSDNEVKQVKVASAGNAVITGESVTAKNVILGDGDSSKLTLKNSESRITTLSVNNNNDITTNSTKASKLTLDTTSGDVLVEITKGVAGEKLDVVLGGGSNQAELTLKNSGATSSTLNSLTLSSVSSVDQNIFNLSAGTTTVTEGVTIADNKGLTINFKNEKTTLVNDIKNSEATLINFEGSDGIINGVVDTLAGKTDINVANNGTIVKGIKTADSNAVTNIAFEAGANTLKLQGSANAITSISAVGDNNTLSLDTKNNTVKADVKKGITGDKLNISFGGTSSHNATLTLENSDVGSSISSISVAENSGRRNNVLNLKANTTTVSGGVSVASGKGLTINLEDNGVSLASNLVSSGDMLVNFRKGENTITGSVTASAGETKLAIADSVNGVISGVVSDANKSAGASGIIVDFAANQAVTSSSLSFGSSGNTISQAKVADNGNAIIKGSDVAIGTVTLGENNQAKLALQNTVSNITTFAVNNTSDVASIFALDANTQAVTVNVTNAINGSNLDVVLGGTTSHIATLTLNNANNGDTTINSLKIKTSSAADDNILNLNARTTSITEGVTIDSSKGLTINFENQTTTLANDVNNSGDTLIDFKGSDGILGGVVKSLGSGSTNIKVTNAGTIVGGIETAGFATTSAATTNIAFASSANILKLQGGKNEITSVSADGVSSALKLDTTKNAVTATVENAITGNNLNIQLGGKDSASATLTLNNTSGNSTIKSLTLTEQTSSIGDNFLNLVKDTTAISGGVSVGASQGLTINLKEDNVNLESNLVSSGGLLVNFEKGTNTITGSITANSGETKLAVAGDVNGVVTGKVSGVDNAYIEFATKATAQNSLTLKFAGNSLKELKVADSGDAVLDGLDVDVSDVKIGGSNNAKLTLKNTDTDITTISVGTTGDSTFALETENQNSVLANVANGINGGNLAVILGGQNDKVATLTLNNANSETVLKSLTLSQNSDINDNILNLNASTTSFVGDVGVNVESGKGLTINFTGTETTLVSALTTAGVSEVNFNGSKDKLDGDVSTSGTSTLNFNGVSSTITGAVSSSGANAKTTINVSGATNSVIGGKVSYDKSGANVLNFLTGTTNSLTLNAGGNQLTELNVGNNGSSTLAGEDVAVATMKLGDSASANLTLKNKKTDITTLNAIGSASTLALNSASNGVEASVTNAVKGNSLTVHFAGTKTDDKPNNTTLFTLKAGGNQLKAITVASDSKGNTLSLESGATSINDKVNIADNSAIDFDLGNTASAQLTLTNNMQNAGVANVNFNKSGGSFGGDMTTSGTTTFAFAEDNGTYGINGNLSTDRAGKNIIDLSSKSATISNDLAFAGSNVANGAGNIINIGASKTLTLKDGSNVIKSMNTASGNTYVNLDGASATFSANAGTSGGAVAFNFNSTSGTLDGDISTSGGITTFNIANAGSGITKGSIDTSSSGVTNVVFADGEDAKSLTLKGASNKITTVSVGGNNNTFALDATDRSVNAEIKNAIAGSALDVNLGGGTNTATLTLNNEGANTTIKSLALTQESGADKNILNLKANTTTINSGISVADKQGLTINLDGTTTTLANTLSNAGNTILNFNATEGMLTGNIVVSGGTTGINFKGAKGTITGAVSTSGTTNIDVANASNGVINGLVNGGGTTNVTFAAKSADTVNTLSLNGADNTITSLKVSDGGESVLLGNKVTMTNMVVGETDSAELTLKNANSVITTLTSAGVDSILSLGKTDNSVLASVTNNADTGNLTLNFGAQGSNKAELTLNGSDNDFKVITLENDSINNKLILNDGTTTFAEKISVGDTSGIAFDLNGANTTLKLSKNLENSGNTAFNFNATGGILEGDISTSGGSTTLNVVNTGSGITKGSIDTTGGETNIVYGASATSLALQGASNKITNVTSAGDSNILALDTTAQGVSAEITNAIGGNTLQVELGGVNDGVSTKKAELILNNASGNTTLASLTLTGVSTDVAQNVLNLNNATTKITAGIELEANKALSINISGKDAQSTTLDNDLLNTAGKLKLDFKSGNGILDGSIATDTAGNTEINVADASNGIIKGAVSGEGNTTIAFATKTDANTNSLTLEGENNKVRTVSVADNANAFLKGKDAVVGELKLGDSGSANLTLQNTDSTITTLTLGGGATVLTLDGASNAVNASVASAVSGNNLTLTLNGKAGGARSGAQGATFTLKNGDNTINTLALGENSSGNKLVLEKGKTTINTQVDVDNADLSVDFANGVELEVTSGFATTSGTSTFNVDASGAENSASVSGGTVSLTNLNLTGTESNSATMAFKNANTTIANVISSGSAILDLSQATGANTRAGSATTTTITNGVDGENLTVKLGGANTGVATLTLNNANGNSTIKALELGGDKNILNLNAHTTTITEGISNADSKEFDINFVSAKLANNLENAGALKLDFSGSSVLDGSLTTTDSGTTDITLNDNARVLIAGDVTTGTTLRGRATPSTASTNVTLGANSALALQGHNNHLSKVTMSNKGVDGETNYLLLTKEKFGDGPARKAVIDELYMSNDKTALILGVQLAETEADAFVFEKTSGTKQTDGATTTFNASPDAGNGGAVDGGVVGAGTEDGSTSEKPDVEQIQSKHKITITLRSGTTLESVGKDGAVLVASVKNDTNDANLKFASKSVAYGDFSQGDATFVTEQRDGYTNYLLGTIKNIQTIVAEQEITATAFTLNYDLYVANFNSLNKRMGDLRANPHSHGVWARVFNGAQTNNFGIGSKSNYTTIQSGYDYAFGGEGFNNYLGFALSYALSMSTARNEFVDKNKQRAINDIYSQAAEVAMYNSFVSDIGWYNDTIAKFSYIMSDFTIDHVGENISTDNSTKNYAFTLSNEFGYLFALGESKEWSITPQLEVGFGYFNQSDFKQTLEQSGAYIISSADAVLTLRTRAGSSFGYDFKRFTQGKGIDASLYVGAFYEFDYIQGGEIRFQTSDAPDVVTNRHSDLKSDGRVVVNVGTNMTIKDNTRLYFDFEKSFVGEITTDYQVNFGVRYSFGESDGYTPISLGIEEQESTKAPLKIEEKGEAKKEDKQEDKKDAKGGEKKEQESKKEVKKDKANEDKKVEEKKEAKPQTEATKKEDKKEVSSKSKDKKVADKKLTDKKVAKK